MGFMHNKMLLYWGYWSRLIRISYIEMLIQLLFSYGKVGVIDPCTTYTYYDV